MKIKSVSKSGCSLHSLFADDCMVNKMYRVTYWKPSKKKQASKTKQRRKA
jgi:hypothetical protein